MKMSRQSYGSDLSDMISRNIYTKKKRGRKKKKGKMVWHLNLLTPENYYIRKTKTITKLKSSEADNYKARASNNINVVARDSRLVEAQQCRA